MREMREGMSFSLSFHQALLGPTGAYWLWTTYLT